MPTEKAHGLQIAKTIESIEKFGHSVTLLVPSRKNHIKTDLSNFYNLETNMRVVRVPDAVRPLQYISEWLYFPIQRLWFVACAFTYGLWWRGPIYSRDLTASFLLSLVGKNVAYEDHQPKQRFVWLYRMMLNAIPKKVVVARNLVERYQELEVDTKNVVVAPNGVDISEFDGVPRDASLWSKKFQIKEGSPVALYVGHFYKWKGVYTLLDAAKNIQANVVLIGGTKEDYEAVSQYAKEEEISNVYLHPFVPHREIIPYIKSADVLVLPNTAHEERSQKYTTPVKLFEYMASGVPIVASNVPSFTHYLENNKNAFLCEPDNAGELAKAVNQIVQSPAHAKALAQSARESVSRYTWDNRARAIADFIEQKNSIIR